MLLHATYEHILGRSRACVTVVQYKDNESCAPRIAGGDPGVLWLCRVSAVDGNTPGQIISGCYDGLLRIWNGTLLLHLKNVIEKHARL